MPEKLHHQGSALRHCRLGQAVASRLWREDDTGPG